MYFVTQTCISTSMIYGIKICIFMYKDKFPYVSSRLQRYLGIVNLRFKLKRQRIHTSIHTYTYVHKGTPTPGYCQKIHLRPSYYQNVKHKWNIAYVLCANIHVIKRYIVNSCITNTNGDQNTSNLDRSQVWHHYLIFFQIRLESPAARLFTQPFIQAQINENIIALRHWPLCGEIHRWPVNSPHKWPVTRKVFPFDDVNMFNEKYD